MNLERKKMEVCLCDMCIFISVYTPVVMCVVFMYERERSAQPVFYEYRVSFPRALLPSFPPKHSPAASVLHSSQKWIRTKLDDKQDINAMAPYRMCLSPSVRLWRL